MIRARSGPVKSHVLMRPTCDNASVDEEHERGGTIGMRNCQLAAFRSFFHIVATKDPGSIAQCVDILKILIKHAPVLEPCDLYPVAVTAILACSPSAHMRQNFSTYGTELGL